MSIASHKYNEIDLKKKKMIKNSLQSMNSSFVPSVLEYADVV